MLGRVFLCRIVFATHSVYLKPPCAHARRKAKGRKHEMRLSSCFRLATRHAKMRKCEDERQNHDTLDVACFRVATFRPARRRYMYDKQEAKKRCMKSVVLLRGGAKGRHAKTRKSDHLAGCRVAFFRLFTPKTR